MNKKTILPIIILLILTALTLAALFSYKSRPEPESVQKPMSSEPNMELHNTDLVTANLPEDKPDSIIYETGNFNKMNLSVVTKKGKNSYLPDGYYYIPEVSRDEIESATWTEDFIVQKQNDLFLYKIADNFPTIINGIKVPDWATVIPIRSSTDYGQMLIALTDQGKITVHPPLLFQLNTITGLASALVIPSSFPQEDITTVVYDSSNNRVIRFLRDEKEHYQRLEMFDLATGAKSSFSFNSSSKISTYTTFLTVQNLKDNRISVVDLMEPKPSLIPLSFKDTSQISADKYDIYTYTGKGSLFARNLSGNTFALGIFQEEQQSNNLVLIHTITMPNSMDLKFGDCNLYIITDTAVGARKYQIAVYDYTSNNIIGKINIPDDIEGSQIVALTNSSEKSCFEDSNEPFL